MDIKWMSTGMNVVTKILCQVTWLIAYSLIHMVPFGSELQMDLHTMIVAPIPFNHFLKARMKTRFPVIIFLLSKKMLMAFYGLVLIRDYALLIKRINDSSDLFTMTIPILCLVIISGI